MRLPRWPGTRNHGANGAATVAGAAARRPLLSEVAPEENASAFVGLGVIGDSPKPALTLIPECLELRHEIAGASAEGLDRYRDGNAALLIALDEVGLLKVRQQCLANPYRHAGRVRERGGRRGSPLGRPCGERGFEPLQMPDGRATKSLKPLLDVEIGRVEQQNAVRRSTVASGASDFLNVLLQRAGDLVMHYVANVRLVDPHAEGARRDHDQTPRRPHELTLGRLPVGSTHLAVILHDRDARPLERARELIDRDGSGAVDDPGPS